MRAAFVAIERWGRIALSHQETARVPRYLRDRWRPYPAQADSEWRSRLTRFRIEVIPWLDTTHCLEGCLVLEVGSGPGASTFALAEQGAFVTGIDLDREKLALGTKLLTEAGLHASLRCINAERMPESESSTGWDHVIFWACLEHMTIGERLSALRRGWDLLRKGGLLSVVETPNRLWPYDSHTSMLPFFSWLPDELAFSYAGFSPRAGFADVFADPAVEMEGFVRRGRGVSYHEFDVAIGDHKQLILRSCLQLERRRRNIMRRVGWMMSGAGWTERDLHRYSPRSDRAWFQPFLYITLEKPG